MSGGQDQHDSSQLLASSRPEFEHPSLARGGLEFTSSAPSSACAALNATIHLLSQRHDSPAIQEPGSILPPPAPAPKSATASMASTESSTIGQRKLCFVTVGATAPFDKLMQAVQTPQFLSTLRDAGYTNLLLQHGHAGDVRPTKEVDGIRISSFDFRKDGIQREIAGAKGDLRKAKAELKSKRDALEGLDFGEDWQNATWDEGVVISHAGSGSILDALRISVPLIVVPNETLLDNHQVDLARELQKQGYVVHGRADRLGEALRSVEAQRLKRKQWPPPPDPNKRGGRGLIGIMDEEMGYTSFSDLPTKAQGSRLYLD